MDRHSRAHRGLPALAHAPLALALAILAGCGGGGSGSGPAPGPATGTTGSTTTVPPVTSVPASTYAAGSSPALAFQELNAARATCGFGQLTQNAQLDAAAAAHAKYMELNGALTHVETQGAPGFTGATPSDRMKAQGYLSAASAEDIASVRSGQSGDAAIRLLLSGPYHAMGLLDAYREVGLGPSTVSGLPTLTVDLANRAGLPGQVTASVITFPCKGVSDAMAVSRGESPSPFPADPSPSWGQPVTVRGPSDLMLTGVSMSGPGGAVQILAIYGDGQMTDPNNNNMLFTKGKFTIIPAPLQANAQYSVSIDYTSGGSHGNTSFTFATAAQ